MPQSTLPSLLNAHVSQFSRRQPSLLVGGAESGSAESGGTSATTYEKYKRQRSLSSLKDPKRESLPLPTPSKVVKLKPAWDRSCTRKISSACVKSGSGADDPFVSWFKRASSLRPSVLRSPKNGGGQSELRGHWQTPKAARQVREGAAVIDGNSASPRQGYRQHILEQVKRQVGTVNNLLPRSAPESKKELQVAIKQRSKSRELVVQVMHVRPSKPSRPKGPSYPGARKRDEQSQQYSSDRTEDGNGSDGIYEDDGSSCCDSDF